MIPSSEREAPRRAPSAAERIVRSWRMLSNSSGLDFTQSPYRIHHVDAVISSEKSAAVKAAELPLSLDGRGRPSLHELSRRTSRTTNDERLTTSHRHLHARLRGKLLRCVISRVHVPNHAHARIGRQHALDALRH